MSFQKCSTGKKIYATELMAEEALIAAWITYNYSHGNGPINMYVCTDCGYYHLTSKGIMNKRLEEHLASGKILRNKDVNAWLEKIKRKNRP